MEKRSRPHAQDASYGMPPTDDDLHDREEAYHSTFDCAPVGIAHTGLDGAWLRVNDQLLRMLGYTAEELRRLRFQDITHPDDLADDLAQLDTLLTGAIRKYAVEKRYIRADGSTFWARVQISLVRERDGTPKYTIAIVEDIGARRASENLNTRRQKQSQALLEITRSALIRPEVNELVERATAAVCSALQIEYAAVIEILADGEGTVVRAAHGWPSALSPGSPLSHVLHTLSNEVVRAGRPLVKTASETETDPNMNTFLTVHGVRGSLSVPLLVSGEVRGAIIAFSRSDSQFAEPEQDFMQAVANVLAVAIERARAEAAIEYQSLHDTLTGLPNRVLLHDRVEQALRSASVERRPLALLVMDLDRFKELNDALGHDRGDHLLRSITERLCHTLRATDTVARLGGDEFAVLLPGADGAAASQAAADILLAMMAPFQLDSSGIVAELSIGIALFPEHGDNAGVLQQRAEVAMYLAKRSATGFAFFTPEYDRHDSSQLQLMADLRGAIARGEVALHYQPKVDMVTGATVGVEALARWKHPDRGWVPPSEFIPLAEHSGLIKELTMHVLRRAVEQMQAWERLGRSMRVAVNLSARNLHDPALAEYIEKLLATHRATPDRLTLEITESGFMQDPDTAMEIVTRLHSLGVRISIDDFGTGYSSLSYLTRLPVSEVKIDRSFISAMIGDDQSSHIVRSIIDLGHNLGLRVVAEGVENQRILDVLSTVGCDVGQGYLFGRPMSGPALEDWLATSAHRLLSGQLAPVSHAGSQG